MKPSEYVSIGALSGITGYNMATDTCCPAHATVAFGVEWALGVFASAMLIAHGGPLYPRPDCRAPPPSPGCLTISHVLAVMASQPFDVVAQRLRASA